MDSRWEFAVWLRELKSASVTTYMGGMGGRFKREGADVYLWLIHADVRQKL